MRTFGRWCGVSVIGAKTTNDLRAVSDVMIHPLVSLAIGLVVAATALLPIAATAADQAASSSGEVDFRRDVRPILAKHCFTCHGPDEEARRAGLRLDTSDGAHADLGGYQAVVPGDADASELMFRVTNEDPDMRMPPADSGDALTEDELETLRRWIESGGRYAAHWAFTPPETVAIPPAGRPGWCRNPIDRFVLAEMERAGLEPAPEADRTEWVRRLYLDLNGVAPPPREVERFLADRGPGAYRRLVERLLASPAYAERFARPWLDLARYADTNGYEKDRPRTIWPYRDWVIDAIAADMPFDQFSMRQLAGDMLPDATESERIATGFHRNTMLNEEGGIDPLEYRYHALVDRVATTGTVWMGLTVGCAQCHTHKYDPITHTDYYSMMAFFNGADEPELEITDRPAEKRRWEIERQIDRIRRRLAQRHLPDFEAFRSGDYKRGPVTDAFTAMIERERQVARVWTTLRPAAMKSTMPKLTLLDDDSVLASGDVTKRDVYRLRFPLEDADGAITGLRLEVLPHESLPAGGPGMAYYEGRRGDFFLSELAVRLDDARLALEKASHSYGKISVGSGSADAANVIDSEGSTGWSTAGEEGTANRLVVNFAEPIEGDGELEIEMLFERHFAAALGRFRFSATRGAAPLSASHLDAPLAARMSAHAEAAEPIDRETYLGLQDHFVETSEALQTQRKPIRELREQKPEPVRTLVMRERDPKNRRTTHRHHRGEYLQPKEEVEPSVPSMFEPLDPSAPRDRLSLARWLVSEKNPLIGRVTVNRAWRQFFGTGIVRTAGDFGTQSEPPSHPRLLDWLANDLREHGWSMKRLHRMIVLSATYRQRVTAPPENDPSHRLLAGMPYRRLDAERIRDTLLSASGLLAREIGGPSVYPPQPESVTTMAYGSPAWATSTGPDRYRRSLYTFSKRTAPFAAYAAFDAPTGELCVARRDRSTTPLQALTLMNDTMYVELARGLAETALRRACAEAEPRDIADRMFRRLLTRTPGRGELEAILGFYQSQRGKLAAGGNRSLEAWTRVARALMNTDEAITIP